MRIFTRIVTAALAAAAALAFATGPAAAKGGGGSGGGTTLEGGTVYYSVGTTTGETYWKMNPDGTGKTMLPAGVGGEPSYVKHGGERWFLRVEGLGEAFSAEYQDEKAELFAVNESGTRRVQLTNLVRSVVTESVVPDHSGTNMWLEECRWVPAINDEDADSKISFLGYVVGTTKDSPNTQWGLYVVDVDWGSIDLRGTYTPGAMILHSELGTVLPGGPSGGSYRGWYQNIRYAWSPDGTKLAFGRWANINAGTTDLWMRDVTTWDGPEDDTFVRTATGPGEWHGNKLVCLDWQFWSVCSIDPTSPDASYVQIVPPSRANTYVQYGSPRWSPSAGFVLYSAHDLTRWDKTFQDVRRVGATGSGNTNLTGDVAGYATPIAWR